MYCSIKDLYIYKAWWWPSLGPKHVAEWILHKGYRYVRRKTIVLCFDRLKPTGHVMYQQFNPLKPELKPICYLLALLGAHHFLHVSSIRVKLLTFRRLMSYIYMEHPFLMFLDHTQRCSAVGRTPLDKW